MEENKDIEEEIEDKELKPDIKPSKDEDNRSLGDKIEDAMDDVVIGVQDLLYGERKSMSEDIPATMPDPDNEIRHINKVQTRRNFNRKYGKTIIKIMLLAVPVILGITIVSALITKLFGG